VSINGKEYTRPAEFGVNSAFAQDAPEVVAVSDVKILMLQREAFVKFKEMKKQQGVRSSPPNSQKRGLDDDDNKVLNELAAVKPAGMARSDTQVWRAHPQFNGSKLEDLEELGMLGEGFFGRVSMVRIKAEVLAVRSPNVKEGEVCALKKMSKKQVVESGQLQQILREKQASAAISGVDDDGNNPFVAQMYATYVDTDSIYMLLNMLQGGEFFSLLHPEDGDVELDPATAKFYVANVFLGLSHIHNCGYIFRDLKPENVMMNSKGYLALVDMGFAKLLPYEEDVHSPRYINPADPAESPPRSTSPSHAENMENSSATPRSPLPNQSMLRLVTRTFTLCGTPEYLAPECIMRLGHNHSADYWALGCLAYEMMHGVTPFLPQNLDDAQLFRNIAQYSMGKYTVEYRGDLDDGDCVSFMDELMHPTGLFRLGASSSNDVRNHKWFADINWKDMTSMKAEPPFVPEIESSTDLSKFEESNAEANEGAVEAFAGDQALFLDW
jgi:serine/threonine protein kinase